MYCTSQNLNSDILIYLITNLDFDDYILNHKYKKLNSSNNEWNKHKEQYFENKQWKNIMLFNDEDSRMHVNFSL